MRSDAKKLQSNFFGVLIGDCGLCMVTLEISDSLLMKTTPGDGQLKVHSRSARNKKNHA